MFDQMVSALAKADKTVEAGDVFGRLTATDNVTKNKYHQRMRHCVCSCGNERTVREHTLLSGESQSCGCLRRDIGIARLVEARKAKKCLASVAN